MMKVARLLGSLSFAASALLATSVYAQDFKELGYESQPNYLNNRQIALTFDDGVDAENTPRVLDILRDKGVKATFFINANNYSGENDPEVAGLINRIISEGHNLGNHTNHHLSLPSLGDDQIRSEITSVEDLVSRDTGGAVSRLTLLRAPFGDGFQSGTDARVAGIVAQYAVQVGWNFDSFDYNCPEGDGGAQCVYDGVFGPLHSGSYGVVLMHSVHSQTASALGRIIDELRNEGYSFLTVEQVVQAKYGQTSGQIYGVNGGSTPPPSNPGSPGNPGHPSSGQCAGVPQWDENAYYSIGNKVVLNNELYINQNENSYPGIEPNVSTWFWADLGSCN